VMTRARLNDIREMLQKNGWSINTSESTIFEVENEEIYWDVFNENKNITGTLRFYLVDYLGRRTEKLVDIFSVEINETGKKLYFEKITSKNWKVFLCNLLEALSR
jgi:hypothetical protein